MTIKVRGTVVVDDQRNIENIVNFTATGNVGGSIIATTDQAEAGEINTKLMTPQRVKEAIEALTPTPGEGEGGDSVIKSIQRGSTYYSGPNPITVPLPLMVNGNKAFISSSVRSDMSGGSAQGIYNDGSYATSKDHILSIAAAASSTASVRLQRVDGNSRNIVVQGGGRVSCQIYGDGRAGVQPVIGSIQVESRGTVEWEVIEFI